MADKRDDGTLVYYVGGYYEYSVNGSVTHTTKYYGSEAMRVDNELRYILSDHLGSTSVVTDGSGNYLAEQRYDAWGLTRYMDGAIPTDKEYTGQRHSRDVGLYDYKARWYDPLLGRFLMEDTIIPQQGIQRIDRYGYVNNRPVSFVDPSGMECTLYLDNGTCVVNYHPHGIRTILNPKVDETKSKKKNEDPPWKPPLSYLSVSDDYEGCSGGVCGHVGIDYSVLSGSNLYASGRGHVVVADICSRNPCVYEGNLASADVNRGYGNVVVIEYPYTSIPNGLREELGLEPGQSVYIVYAHLEDINVEAGDIVSPGDIIGHTGNTGNSTAPHLHLEVKIFPYHSIPTGMMCGEISCYPPEFNATHPGWNTIPDPQANYGRLIPSSEIYRKDPAILHKYYEWPWP